MCENSEYINPLDIVFFFSTEEKVADFFNYFILNTQKLSNTNDQKTFISPIVYIKNAFVFNIDYNYLVQSIATWSGIEQIYKDFKIDDIDNEKNQYTYQMFLIKGLFEYVYGLVWLRDSIDTSKYSEKIVKLKPRFCNMLVLKKQNCFAQFFAVPFSKRALKSLLSRETYLALLKLSKYRYEQLAFGHKQYSVLDLSVRKELAKF
ncbi:MAG TPA: hypothetical protein PLM93_11895 [Sulfuricurvum sp.]|nr:MAG: hypothetical protein B7Y30_11605 [Campylobacterales bacterium 16-40-21]OZA02038.1 MAG: hypothetical protein B7X89_10975 [Sulfuricurvum sp. 17-40-25]HQS67878.1 hypothetical protein [Sulfuricurvum sp.]HQT37278.1 hypothetical protein [Sulfuricurvum sp.]